MMKTKILKILTFFRKLVIATTTGLLAIILTLALAKLAALIPTTTIVTLLTTLGIIAGGWLIAVAFGLID